MATSCSRQTIYDINRSKKKRNVTLATNAMNFYDIIAMIREQDAQKILKIDLYATFLHTPILNSLFL
ncbi:Hypothetical predicted protein, partial [Paramuricea clavata]